MTLRRVIFQIAVVLTAVLLQVCIVNRLGLPGGTPDLVVIVVVAFALVGGPQRGAIVGFAAGLAVDFLPPADHLAGRFAFAYAIVGYLAGLLEDAEETSVITTILLVGAGSAAAVLLYAGVGVLISDPRVTPRATAHALVATVVYDVVLAPFIVPLVSAATRRLEPAGPR